MDTNTQIRIFRMYCQCHFSLMTTMGVFSTAPNGISAKNKTPCNLHGLMGQGPYGARARAPGPHFLGERIFKKNTLKKQACGFCSKHNRKNKTPGKNGGHHKRANNNSGEALHKHRTPCHHQCIDGFLHVGQQCEASVH